MRKTIHKLFWVWEFDKEEQWLNEMAAKGLCLISVGFCRYEFEDCIPGEYKFCLQMLEKNVKNAESEKYIAFIEETGAEHVGTFQKWVYFRRKADCGSFELFSDNESRVKYLTRIIHFILWIGIFNLIVAAYNLILLPLMTQHVLSFSVINLVLGIFALLGAWKLSKKRNNIKQDGQLFE